MALTANTATITNVDFADQIKISTFGAYAAAFSGHVFTCPCTEGIEILSVQWFHATAPGGTSTLQVVKTASGTAAGSGTSILTGGTAVDITTTTATKRLLTLDLTANTLTASQLLGITILVGSGTLAGMYVQMAWRPLLPQNTRSS